MRGYSRVCFVTKLLCKLGLDNSVVSTKIMKVRPPHRGKEGGNNANV